MKIFVSTFSIGLYMAHSAAFACSINFADPDMMIPLLQTPTVQAKLRAVGGTIDGVSYDIQNTTLTVGISGVDYRFKPVLKPVPHKPGTPAACGELDTEELN